MGNLKPHGIKQAEMAIWASIVVSALVALVDYWTAVISGGQYAATLILYAFTCIIPYKIGRGSNATRYLYAVLTAFSVFAMLSGTVTMPTLDWIVSILLLPLTGFIFYQLFHRDAAEWFGSPK